MTTAITERRKSRTGRVVTDKMDKTVIIAVDRRVRHRLYGKVLKRISKLVAHDLWNRNGRSRSTENRVGLPTIRQSVRAARADA